jgi:hypothetical protein
LKGHFAFKNNLRRGHFLVRYDWVIASGSSVFLCSIAAAAPLLWNVLTLLTDYRGNLETNHPTSYGGDEQEEEEEAEINADDETIKQVNARHGCVCLIPVAGTGMVLPCR